MVDAELYALAAELGQRLAAAGLHVATAESCTGGGIGAAITAVPGSSGWFDCGYICYSNAAKQAMLGVNAATLMQFGAVSAETVAEMASGARQRSGCDLSVAVSGIAGPDGGTPDKPVGTVWLGWSNVDGRVATHCFVFAGDRDAIRRQAVREALRGLLRLSEADV